MCPKVIASLLYDISLMESFIRMLYCEIAESCKIVIIRYHNISSYIIISHMNMEAEKSHSPPSANWKPRKAIDIVWLRGSWWYGFQSESKGQRNKKARGRRYLMSSSAVRQRYFSLPPPFYSIQASQWIGWYPHCREPSALFSPLIQMLISFRSTLIDKPGNNVYPAIWAFCDIVKVTHKVTHDDVHDE